MEYKLKASNKLFYLDRLNSSDALEQKYFGDNNFPRKSLTSDWVENYIYRKSKSSTTTPFSKANDRA